VPHVASEPGIFSARLHDFSPRGRAAGAAAKEAPSPFALLVETPESPPPTQKDRGEQVQANRASRAQDTAPNRNERAPDRPEPSDSTDNPTQDTENLKKSEEPKALAAGETPAKSDAAKGEDDAKTVTADTLEAAVVTAAIADGTAVPPEQPPIVAPVVIPAALVAQSNAGQSTEGTDSIAAATGKADSIAPTTGENAPTAGAPVAAPKGPETPDTPDTTDISAAPKGEQAAAKERTGPDLQPAVNADETRAEITAAVATASPKNAEDRTAADPKRITVDKPAAKVSNAAASETSKNRTLSEPRPVNTGEQVTEASPEATEKTERNSAPAEPDEARSTQAHQRAHDHADTPAPTDASSQTLGAQVSEAARGTKPPSEAVHAILQANDRPVGPAAQATTTQTALEATVPIAGLAVEIAARAQAGHNHFEIRLDPPELGRIDVRLDVDHSGQVHSRLVVERAETLEYLRRDVAELERALQQAGLKTGDNGFQFTLRDQGFSGRNDGNNSPHAAHLVVPDPDLAPIDTLPGGYGRTWRASGGIDIRV
jgi:flagellar hook-length control protein FliK